MQPHLLVILDYYLPHRGGIEVSAQQHIHLALEAGYRVSVLTGHHSTWLPTQEIIQTAYGSYAVYRTGGGRFSFWRSGRRFLREFLDDHQVDLIHGHTYVGAVLASRSGKRFGIPVLVSIHEVFNRLWYRMKPWRSAWIYRMLERWIVTRSYDHIHVPSKFTKQMLVDDFGITKNTITEIYHDLDPSRDPHVIDSRLIHDRQMKLGPHRYKILYYGHAGASKGIDTLVDVLGEWLPGHTEVLFVANITASRNRSQLIKKIRRVFPTGSYHIETGMPRDHLQALVMAADLVIVPSLSEGFGFVGAEVSALGKDAIIARSGALPEIVSGPVCLYDQSDTQKLVRLLDQCVDGYEPPHLDTSYESHDNASAILSVYEMLLDTKKDPMQGSLAS